MTEPKPKTHVLTRTIKYLRNPDPNNPDERLIRPWTKRAKVPPGVGQPKAKAKVFGAPKGK